MKPTKRNEQKGRSALFTALGGISGVDVAAAAADDDDDVCEERDKEEEEDVLISLTRAPER